MLLHTQIDIFTDTALFPIQMGLAKKKEKNNLFLSFFLSLFVPSRSEIRGMAVLVYQAVIHLVRISGCRNNI